MRTRIPHFVVFLCLLVVLSIERTAWSQATVVYSSTAIRGQVVAKETGRPLGNVLLVAAWQGNKAIQLVYPQTVKVIETTSAADGTFVIAAWGPVSLPSPVSSETPTLLAYLPGYDGEAVPLWLSGKNVTYHEIRLQRSQRTPEDQAQMLMQMAFGLAYIYAPLKDQPKSKMFAAIEAEWRKLPDDAFPERTGKDRVPLTTMFHRMVEEFRRAIEYYSLEK